MQFDIRRQTAAGKLPHQDISGIGSLLGILIALAIPVMVRPLLPGNLRVPVPWVSVVLAFLVACSTGLFFGYLPANKAAKLQPTESLRYE